MRFRTIGRKTAGHPVLWLLFLCVTSLGAAWMAYESYHDYAIDRSTGTPVLVPQPSWSGVILWSGMSLVAAYHAMRVARACRRMLARPFPKLPGMPRSTLCRHCGYDLRATPRQCPECGARYGEVKV